MDCFKCVCHVVWGKIRLNLFEAIKWENISLGQRATKNTNTTVKTRLWGCNQTLQLQRAKRLPCSSMSTCFLFRPYLFFYLFTCSKKKTLFADDGAEKKTKNVALRGFGLGKDDGGLSIILCFYTATLLPVQPSMHG